MAGESVQELLAKLTGDAGDSAEAIYCNYAGLTIGSADGETLEELVRTKLTNDGHTAAAAKENLLSMLLANGAGNTPSTNPPESVEQCLLLNGLTGWT